MKKRKLRSWLTLLGIFIGIAAVVSLISMGEGLRTAITGQFGELSVDTLTFSNAETSFGPPGSTAVKKINDNDIRLIESVNNVKIIIPRLIRVAKIEYNKAASFGYVINMPEDKEKIDFIYTNMNIEVDEGGLLDLNDKGKVLLGNDYLNENKFEKKVRIGSNIIIQGKSFEVVGILKKASTFTINSVVLMLDSDMRDILNIPKDEHDILAIRINSKENVEKAAKDIENEIRKDRKEKIGEEDFKVQTPLQSISAVNTILDVVNIIVIGIAAISLLIGGIGIANTMYTSVLERKAEIGTMKAIGAKNLDILKLFVIESGLFGLAGGVAGAVLGIFLAYLVSVSANFYFGNNIFAFSINWVLIIGAIMFSFLIGVLAGLVPSYQASKLKPVDALRG
ncbi:MAG TPA: ABC transporter permease [Candidatus Nanoarchaeia archaeon]|nr:ABC transporter permease [Candidatus Pacearchaeota archaeon]HLC87327.1 ABC transporter permease [Candidatus Nanoarchaeia archaeon]